MISLLESQEEIKSARAMLRSEGLDFAQHCVGAGVPTITSAPEVYEPDIVDRTNCVLVREDTAEAWERALEQVLFNDELKRELREGALSTAERFSWPKLIRKHLDLYESVLDGR